jgi:hypothetical protein
MSDQWSVTDSPWFWVASFSAMALVGLFIVGPKYAVREASWEQKLITRGGIQRPPEDPASEQNTGETPVPPEPAQPNLLVPLWRLKIVAAAVWLVACGMLWRQVHGRRPTEGRSL